MTFLAKNILQFSRLISLMMVAFYFFGCKSTASTQTVDVLVLGGGTGGTAAAIQAGRMGVATILIEPGPWLGGMLTAAGVSAVDGNHRLPAGIWYEFREALRDHYGGAKALETGWVSNTQFEPHVGADIFYYMAEVIPSLQLWLESRWTNIEKTADGWLVTATRKDGSIQQIKAKILIDGTDLGDAAAAAGAGFDLGMDARAYSGEAIAPEQANDIIQDLTFTAILKDYGPGSDRTIPRPEGYDSTLFLCSCQTLCNTEEKTHPCETMMSYAKLPNEKYLINWPLRGNDIYLDLVEKTPEQRDSLLQSAKLKTLQFIYFIQKDLGYKNLGLADDEFPTADLLPIIPYHREGRRVHGLARINIHHLTDPYTQQLSLYRTGLAVGDYPVDHHHKERPDAPDIAFPPVPSFNIPGGCLIPKGVDNLLVADKAISVTNVVNGSSRLQPVILQVGQAAGLMAALAAKRNITPSALPVRMVQDTMMFYNGYLLPFIDVPSDTSDFDAIQRIGATGILRGRGVPYQWANQTWFDPDSLLTGGALREGLSGWPGADSHLSLLPEGKQPVSGEQLAQLITALAGNPDLGNKIRSESDFDGSQPVTRRQAAVLLDRYWDPFHLFPVDWSGKILE